MLIHQKDIMVIFIKPQIGFILDFQLRLVITKLEEWNTYTHLQFLI